MTSNLYAFLGGFLLVSLRKQLRFQVVSATKRGEIFPFWATCAARIGRHPRTTGTDPARSMFTAKGTERSNGLHLVAMASNRVALKKEEGRRKKEKKIVTSVFLSSLDAIGILEHLLNPGLLKRFFG